MRPGRPGSLQGLAASIAAAAFLFAAPASGQQPAPQPPAESASPKTMSAETMSAETTAAEAASAEAGGLLDLYSRVMFRMNRSVYGTLDQFSAWQSQWWPQSEETTAPHNAPSSGSMSNVAANLVNEPVTAATALVAGDLSTSWRSVERFAINSTVGVLGYYDTASNWGYTPNHTDAGLILCKAGVGEGPYLVLPFVGPRTSRDAVADIVLTNAVLWTLAGTLLGTGASLQTIVIAESIEIVADIVATRQIDPNAKAIGFENYDHTREAYLAQRRERCSALRGEKPAG